MRAADKQDYTPLTVLHGRFTERKFS
jgi:hypothetical protein